MKPTLRQSVKQVFPYTLTIWVVTAFIVVQSFVLGGVYTRMGITTLVLTTLVYVSLLIRAVYKHYNPVNANHSAKERVLDIIRDQYRLPVTMFCMWSGMSIVFTGLSIGEMFLENFWKGLIQSLIYGLLSYLLIIRLLRLVEEYTYAEEVCDESD